MKTAAYISIVLLVAAVATVYIAERSKTHASLGDSQFVWFVAVKHGPQRLNASSIDDEKRVEWRSRSDSVLVGDAPPYWDEFLLVGGGGNAAPPTVTGSVEDAYVARIDPVRLPVLLTGAYSMLHRLGIWRIPQGTLGEDLSEVGFDAGVGPSPENVETLRSRPADQKPAMVNFLRYFEDASNNGSREEAISGEEAYALYGSVALKTIYRLGGRLIVAGKIVEVVRAPRAGPTLGKWDDIAIMQYPSQQAILSLEQVPEYRAALIHRNAGLERTRIVVSVGF